MFKKHKVNPISETFKIFKQSIKAHMYVCEREKTVSEYKGKASHISDVS